MSDSIALKCLWQSVIVIAIRDLCNSDPRMEERRQDAERWIGRLPSADFREVCMLAGLDAGNAHGALRSLCQQPPKYRAELLRALRQSRLDKKAESMTIVPMCSRATRMS